MSSIDLEDSHWNSLGKQAKALLGLSESVAQEVAGHYAAPLSNAEALLLQRLAKADQLDKSERAQAMDLLRRNRKAMETLAHHLMPKPAAQSATERLDS